MKHQKTPIYDKAAEAAKHLEIAARELRTAGEVNRRQAGTPRERMTTAVAKARAALESLEKAMEGFCARSGRG